MTANQTHAQITAHAQIWWQTTAARAQTVLQASIVRIALITVRTQTARRTAYAITYSQVSVVFVTVATSANIVSLK